MKNIMKIEEISYQDLLLMLNDINREINYLTSFEGRENGEVLRVLKIKREITLDEYYNILKNIKEEIKKRQKLFRDNRI